MMAVTSNGYLQAIHRIKQHSRKFEPMMLNYVPRGMSKKQTIMALESIRASADKAIEFLEKRNKQ